MSIDATALANLLTLRKPAVAAYWKVIWDANDSGEDRYYSDKAYHELPPFTEIGVEIEPRIMDSVVKDTQFEINPDLKAETINLNFDDIDREISGKFQTFKSGVRCELIFYYPNPGGDSITTSVWFGQLQAPDIYGYKTVKTKATNGFRSREQQIPRRPRPRECTSNFGAWMPSEFASETNLCPYDRHLGGSVGNLNPATGQPYTDCPRDSTSTCDTRLGTTDGKYFGGFTTDAAATQTSTQGFIAISKGNTSALDKPIRVIAGGKIVREMQPLLFRHRTPVVNSWVDVVFEVGEGPIQSVQWANVYGKNIEAIHLAIRLGERGQPRTHYAVNVSNFSNTAHCFAAVGWVDLSDGKKIGVDELKASGFILGYREVAVFTDPSTYTRIWTDNRIWWLLELFTNQRFGLAYPESRFELDDWIDVAAWADNSVSFEALFADGETVTYSGRRTSFDAILEGRPVAEQLEDICRSGSVSVPFQHDGKFTISKLTAITDDQYTNARVFTDTGENKNIVWGSGQPEISLGQTPDNKLINEVSITYEEAVGNDVARSITVDDPNQKLKAGREMGEDNLKPIPKKFSGFGIRATQEAVRLGYRILRFGEFDEGGTQNNLKVTFSTPFEQTLGLKRYDFIRVTSSLLDGFEIGTGEWICPPDIFRILKMKKVGNGLVQITAQAYNDAAYLDFERVTVVTPPSSIVCAIDADCPTGYVCSPATFRCIPRNPPPPCDLTFGSDPTYDTATQMLTVPEPPDC